MLRPTTFLTEACGITSLEAVSAVSGASGASGAEQDQSPCLFFFKYIFIFQPTSWKNSPLLDKSNGNKWPCAWWCDADKSCQDDWEHHKLNIYRRPDYLLNKLYVVVHHQMLMAVQSAHPLRSANQESSSNLPTTLSLTSRTLKSVPLFTSRTSAEPRPWSTPPQR